MFDIYIQFVNGEAIRIRSEELPEPNDDKTILTVTNADTGEIFMAFTAHILYFTVCECESESEAERLLNYCNKLRKENDIHS